MELYTADGLPVGPAAQHGRSAAQQPPCNALTHAEGASLVALHGLFLRLHRAGSNAPPTDNENSDGSGGGGPQSKGKGAGGAAAASPAPAGAALAAALVDALKPSAAQALRSVLLRGPRPGGSGDDDVADEDGADGGGGYGDPRHRLPSVASGAMLQLMGRSAAGAGDSDADGADKADDGGARFLGRGSAAWGDVLATATVALPAGAPPSPHFLLPSRFFPHTTMLRGFRSAAAKGNAAVQQRNSNRSALLVEEAALRGIAGGAGRPRRRSEDSANRRHDREPAEDPEEEDDDDDRQATRNSADANGSAGGDDDRGGAAEEERGASAVAAESESESESEEEEEGEAGSISSSSSSSSSRPKSHSCAQLMIESAQRRLFCVPVFSPPPAVGAAPDALSCVLLACGSVPA